MKATQAKFAQIARLEVELDHDTFCRIGHVTSVDGQLASIKWDDDSVSVEHVLDLHYAYAPQVDIITKRACAPVHGEWAAFVSGRADACGFGVTEAEAIIDLLDQLENA